MKVNGNIDLLNNQIRQAALQQETTFPTSPVLGRIIFVNKRVFIAAELSGGAAAWVPLTNEIDTYIHRQNTAASVWTVTHNLKCGTPLVQIYDTNNIMILVDTVEIIDENTISITVGTSMAGRAVVMAGDQAGAEKSEFDYEFTQAVAASTWTVYHGLGHYPIVRVFISGQEVVPQSVVHNSKFQTTITFSSAQTGVARFV